MNLFIYLCGGLFFLLGKVSFFAAGSDENATLSFREEDEFLRKLTEKLDNWSETVVKGVENFKDLNDNVKNLQNNLNTCKDGKVLPAESSQSQKKMNHLLSKLELISKNVELNAVHAGAIKSLERKLARLQYSLDRTLLRNELLGTKLSDEVSSSKSLYEVERGLMDMSSKVDALYDKFATDEVYGFDNPNEIRHLGKSCRMLAIPYKKLLASVDYLRKVVKDIDPIDEMDGKGSELKHSSLSLIRDYLENILDEIQVLKKRSEKNINENEKILRRIDKKLDSELEDDDDDDEKLKKSLKKYMIEQRQILEKTMKKLLKGKNGISDDDDDDESIVCDDSDENGSKSCEKESRKKKKSKKNNDSDSGDANDDDDDDDDDDDNDNDHDESNMICDDSDENGSKSCEKERKKAYSRGKKKFRFNKVVDVDEENDEDDDDDDDDDMAKFLRNRKKIKKSLKEIENIAVHDLNDKLVADAPLLVRDQQPEGQQQQFLREPQAPEDQAGRKKIPDVTP